MMPVPKRACQLPLPGAEHAHSYKGQEPTADRGQQHQPADHQGGCPTPGLDRHAKRKP
jgi:hypothetical protein